VKNNKQIKKLIFNIGQHQGISGLSGCVLKGYELIKIERKNNKDFCVFIKI
jgi:hypothetical protein